MKIKLWDSSEYEQDMWENGEAEAEFDYVMESLEEIEGEASITGKLGLWNGTKDIIPVTCENVATAVRNCIKNADNVVIIDIEGELNVEVYHHDGVNRFQINVDGNKVYLADRIRGEYKTK